MDAEEAKSIFESNFSHIYYILYDTFVTAEANLRQRGTVNYLSYTVYFHVVVSLLCNLEVCHPQCVCENWKGYVAKHNYVN